MSRIEFVHAEVLAVGPDEVLIIKLPEDTSIGNEEVAVLVDYLAEAGLKDRSLVFVGEAEFIKAKRQ